MNKYIKDYINLTYGINVEHCTKEDFLKVTEIKTSDVTGISKTQDSYDWDYSKFPNLKILDCSHNYIDTINVLQNTLLEEIIWQGVRGYFSNPINLSGNVHLKKITAGQDGLVEIDFSNNVELEEININLSSTLRWVNLDNCPKLKRIGLRGASIPFVDLTHCPNLEYCDIHYWNLFRNKRDVYGDGYPRPLIFVPNDFDENIIPTNTRTQSYYAYYLIRTQSNSAESRFLEFLKSKRNDIISMPSDNYGQNLAKMHYQLLETLSSFRNENF